MKSFNRFSNMSEKFKNLLLWGSDLSVLHFKMYSLHKKMKFSIKDFFYKCDRICRKLRIWSRLLKNFVMENIIFCVVIWEHCEQYIPIDLFPYKGTNFKSAKRLKNDLWRFKNCLSSFLFLTLKTYAREVYLA